MSKNPFINAISALGYITIVAFTMHFVSNSGQSPDKTILGPIAFLSLISLSASVMGYLFLYNPISLLIEGKKKEAVDLLLKTIGTFAVITVILFIIVFSGILGSFIPVNF